MALAGLSVEQRPSTGREAAGSALKNAEDYRGWAQKRLDLKPEGPHAGM
jgi:hypothetical protein